MAMEVEWAVEEHHATDGIPEVVSTKKFGRDESAAREYADSVPGSSLIWRYKMRWRKASEQLP